MPLRHVRHSNLSPGCHSTRLREDTDKHGCRRDVCDSLYDWTTRPRGSPPLPEGDLRRPILMLDCGQESGYDMSEMEPETDIHRCGKCVIPVDK